MGHTKSFATFGQCSMRINVKMPRIIFMTFTSNDTAIPRLNAAERNERFKDCKNLDLLVLKDRGLVGGSVLRVRKE